MSTDLLSCWAQTENSKRGFVTLSARYMAIKSDAQRREEIREEKEEAGEILDHLCFESNLTKGFEFIKESGVLREDEKDAIGFTPWYGRHAVHQPVGAALRIFEPDYDNLGPDDIYDGPQTPQSVLAAANHVVIIVAVLRLHGQLVAKCKSSHGTRRQRDGYLYVSLTTMVTSTCGTKPHPSSLFVRDASMDERWWRRSGGNRVKSNVFPKPPRYPPPSYPFPDPRLSSLRPPPPQSPHPPNEPF
ncbi:unnamed protein product [Arabis nemorensis]|uniref:Uncharacterized protein n=1 Tax=Arabis nemorensis TaxID=586526 RepID=A0A565CSW2_9BRAS|nr:unnamed protein product [Arabis nemorensis]